MAGEELFSFLNHILPLIYPMFTYVDSDSYSKYGSGSTKVLNTDPIWIRIHKTAYFNSILLSRVCGATGTDCCCYPFLLRFGQGQQAEDVRLGQLLLGC